MLRTGKVSLLLCLALTALAGCGRDNVAEDQGPEFLYMRGFDAMDASNFAGAIQYFQALEARYPFSPETRQAQLDLIYLYYRSQQPEQAVDAIRRDANRALPRRYPGNDALTRSLG